MREFNVDDEVFFVYRDKIRRGRIYQKSTIETREKGTSVSYLVNIITEGGLPIYAERIFRNEEAAELYLARGYVNEDCYGPASTRLLSSGRIDLSRKSALLTKKKADLVALINKEIEKLEREC